MNYLAHIFLSHKLPALMLGNFLGDLVNNKEYLELPDKIQEGVRLHRKIDRFTDHHTIVGQAVQLLQPYHHKYAPVVIDILYDYLLTYNWNKYSDESIQDYASWAYAQILSYTDILPQRNKMKIEMMVSHNWLLGYGDLDHLHSTFMRVKKRAKFDNQFEHATTHLKTHFDELNQGFNDFFVDLMAYSQEYIAALNLPD